jgi:hypothetical protein
MKDSNGYNDADEFMEHLESEFKEYFGSEFTEYDTFDMSAIVGWFASSDVAVRHQLDERHAACTTGAYIAQERETRAFKDVEALGPSADGDMPVVQIWIERLNEAQSISRSLIDIVRFRDAADMAVSPEDVFGPIFRYVVDPVLSQSTDEIDEKQLAQMLERRALWDRPQEHTASIKVGRDHSSASAWCFLVRSASDINSRKFHSSHRYGFARLRSVVESAIRGSLGAAWRHIATAVSSVVLPSFR